MSRRGATTAVGRYDEDPATGMRFVVPFDRRLLMDVQVPRGEERGARPGEMVTVEITRWPTPTRGPVGRVVGVLGAIDAPGVDTQIIIRKHGIPDAHGESALAEARRLGTKVRQADLRGRTDFRAWPTVTIDGEHARDFDDAVTLELLPNGHYCWACTSRTCRTTWPGAAPWTRRPTSAAGVQSERVKGPLMSLISLFMNVS